MIALFFLLFVALSVQAPLNIAVVHSDSNAGGPTDIDAQLFGADPLFGVINAKIVASVATPTANDLKDFDAVLVYGDQAFADATGLGNALADYVDNGGHVVVAGNTFNTATSTVVGGRFASGGYYPLTTDGLQTPSPLTPPPLQEFLSDVPGTRLDGHFLLFDVATFDGGAQSTRNRALPTTGTTKVAHWTTRGSLESVTFPRDPLIAFKKQVVALNYFPVSSAVNAAFWNAATDGDEILANALLYLVKPKFDAALPVVSDITTTNFTINAATLVHTGGDDIFENGYLCAVNALPDFTTPGVQKRIVANATIGSLVLGEALFTGFPPNSNVACRAYARNRFAESATTFTVQTSFGPVITFNTCTLPTLQCPGPVSLFTNVGDCVAPFTPQAPFTFSSCAVNPVKYTLSGATINNVAALVVGGPSVDFKKGVTSVNYAVTDNFGNTGTCATTVTVVDNVLPTITCPANIVGVNTRAGICTNVQTYTETINDNCAGSTVSFAMSGATTSTGAGSGSNSVAFVKGQTTVKLTVTDAANNKASCQFTVDVADIEPPTIAFCPATKRVAGVTANCEAVFVKVNATGRDNCAPQPDALPALSFEYTGATAGTGVGLGPQLFDIGTTTVTLKTKDVAGLSAPDCVFDVEVPFQCGPGVFGGSCVPGVLTPYICESCAVGGGLASGAVCDDQDPKTMNDHCANNKCEGCRFVNQPCDDGIKATTGDICTNVGTAAAPDLFCAGCGILADGALCDDKNPLTVAEYCIAGVCRAKETSCNDLRDDNANGLIDCADFVDCPTTTLCNDGDASTTGERCSAEGRCVAERCDVPGDEDGDGFADCADEDCRHKACGDASSHGNVCAEFPAMSGTWECLGCGSGDQRDGAKCDDRRSDTFLDTCSGNKCCGGGSTKSVALFGHVTTFDLNSDGTFDSCPSSKRAVAPPGSHFVELIAQASVVNNLGGQSAKHCHLFAAWVIDSNVVARSKVNVDSDSSSSSSSSEQTTSNNLFHFSAHEVLTLKTGLHVAELQLHFKPECQFTFGQVNWVFGITSVSSESQLSSSSD